MVAMLRFAALAAGACIAGHANGAALISRQVLGEDTVGATTSDAPVTVPSLLEDSVTTTAPAEVPQILPKVVDSPDSATALDHTFQLEQLQVCVCVLMQQPQATHSVRGRTPTAPIAALRTCMHTRVRTARRLAYAHTHARVRTHARTIEGHAHEKHSTRALMQSARTREAHTDACTHG